jgi:hypothetical protein
LVRGYDSPVIRGNATTAGVDPGAAAAACRLRISGELAGAAAGSMATGRLLKSM